MFRRPSVRQYCEATCVVAVVVVALMHSSIHFEYMSRYPVRAWLLVLAVVLSELLPVTIPRRGEDEVITLSTSFVMALLLAGGLGPALVAQIAASLIQDIHSRRPWWRSRFNAAQYALSLIAAYLTLQWLGATAHVATLHPFSSGQIPAVLLSAAVFMLVNTGIVGVAVAIYQEISIVRYFRAGLAFVFLTIGVLGLLAPVIIATAAYSIVLVPLLAAPILLMHKTIWAGARSDHAARHDQLTGLPNRAAFHEEFDRLVGQERREASIMLMDLDRFKQVNDTLGHHAGDALLQQVAERLRGQLRRGDVIARLGGDEFAVICPGCPGQAAVAAARRLIDALEAPFDIDGNTVDVGVSIGVARFPNDGLQIEVLLQRADVAMYRAKQSRRGALLYAHDTTEPGSSEQLGSADELRAALDSEQILAVYQPELDLLTGTVKSIEALVRWQHPEHGVVSPADFLHTAERAGLMGAVTDRMLALAIEQVKRWRGLGIAVRVAVNVCTEALTAHDFADRVFASLDEAGVPGEWLKLEVAEAAFQVDPDAIRNILQRLHARGITLSINGFGVGSCSLARLVDLPVAELKVDRSFVTRLEHDVNDSIVVSAAIELAHRLGMRAVAVGVEDESVLPKLRVLGCDLAQGHAIARPMPAESLTKYLLRREDAVQLSPEVHPA